MPLTRLRALAVLALTLVAGLAAAPTAHAQAAPAPDLEVVVQETDGAHADHEEEQQHAAGGETPAAAVGDDQVRAHIADDGRPDDHRPAHRGRSPGRTGSA